MSFNSAFFLADEGGTCLPDTWAAGVAPSLDSKSLGCAVINAMLCCHCLNAQSKTKTTQSCGGEPNFHSSRGRRAKNRTNEVHGHVSSYQYA